MTVSIFSGIVLVEAVLASRININNHIPIPFQPHVKLSLDLSRLIGSEG